MMMRRFTYQGLPGRVVFGQGSLERLVDEIERMQVSRTLVLSTPSRRYQAEEIATRLGERAAGTFDKAVVHVPLEIAQAARREALRLDADCCVAIGGGSTIGLAKAIALELELPILLIPTTYSGSEMTPVWGLTEGGVKRTGRDMRTLPATVIYDPVLTVSMPPRLSGVSGMNAIAHCVEALYAENANPLTSLIAQEGMRALATSLPAAAHKPDDLDARAEALYGAWLAGAALAAVGMALHHKLCHTLGGTFNLPHAEIHTLILPHVAAYNAVAAPEAMGRIAATLGSENAWGGLYDLAASLGARMALRDFGLGERDLERAADLAVRNPYYNPRPFTRDGIRALLDDAYHGRRPVVTGQGENDGAMPGGRR